MLTVSLFATRAPRTFSFSATARAAPDEPPRDAQCVPIRSYSNGRSINDSTPNRLTDPTNPPAEPQAKLRYRAAYQQVLPEAAALKEAELLNINIDVTAAVATATGALPEIMALRERATKLGELDMQVFDKLSTYALALMHAQGEYVAASMPPEQLLALNDQGNTLRDLLHSDATALAKRGLMNGARLSSFRIMPGYKVLAEDLVGLSSLLRHSWDGIANKTAITQAELDLAEELSDKLLMAVGAREQAPAVLAEVARQRQRLFTLFVNAYDQVRRAVSYLRWTEDDLETIAPSLYSNRTRRKTEKPVTPPEPPAPAPPTGPAAASPLTSPASVTVNAPTTTTPIAAGLPGSSPFAS